MSVFIVSGSNAPATTEVVMGQFLDNTGNIKSVNINVEEIQDPAKKAVYDAFFDMVGNNVSVELINSPYQGDFNHVTPSAVALEALVIDYNTLSAGDKAKVDNAFTMLNEIPEEPIAV
jgi:hypothetical protein